MRKHLKSEIKNIFFILSGSIVLGLAYSLFLIPHHIVPGGVSGIAIILNYFFKFPVGLTSILLNIPILYLGVKVLGGKYGIRTIGGMLILNFAIDFMHEILKLPSATENSLLASIYGGILLGLGLGLVFKGRASTGGTDVIGMVINKWTGISVGVGIFIVDFFIISTSGFAYHSLEAPLIGYLTLFLSSKVIDFVLEGWTYAKLALIITEKENSVKDFILKEMGRGGTFLHGETFYLGKPRKVIMTVISRKEFPILRQEIKNIDPGSFVIITDVYEVVGKGFRTRSL